MLNRILAITKDRLCLLPHFSVVIIAVKSMNRI